MLAKFYAQKQNVDKSLEYYQQHFDSARLEKKENNKKYIDQTRVIYAIAKANFHMSFFFPNFSLIYSF